MRALPLLLLAAWSLDAHAAYSLLLRANLRASDGVQNEGRVRDGQVVDEGDFWNTQATSIIGPNGRIEWDLGASVPLAAGAIQADNNDDYLLHGSEDGQSWTLLWQAGPWGEAGMRTRTATFNPPKSARYLRLTAQGGDQLFSVSELQLFSNAADLATSDLVKKARTAAARPQPQGCGGDTWVLLLLGGAALFLFFKVLRSAGKKEEPKPPAPPSAAP